MQTTVKRYPQQFKRSVMIAMLMFLMGQMLLNAQVFQRLNEENGLPINLVSDIIQDKYGFIWIATDAGLVRFDGSRTIVFQHDAADTSSISTSIPVKLAEDVNEDLWIASHEGQLNHYIIDSDLFEHFELSSISSLPDNRVYSLHIDELGIWVGMTAGLVHFNPKTKQNQFFSLTDLTSDSVIGEHTVFDIIPDSNQENHLWLFTYAGLFHLNESSLQANYYVQDDQNPDDILALRSGISEEDFVWTSNSRNGIKRFSIKNKDWTNFIDQNLIDPAGFNGVSDMARKSTDALWITSWRRGFGEFNTKTQTYNFIKRDENNSNSLQGGELSTLFIDADKNLWLGGTEGVSFFNPSLQLFHSISLPERTIVHDKTHNFPSSTVQLNDSTLLIGTVSGNGLYLASTKTNECSLITNYSNNSYQELEREARSQKLSSLDVHDLLKVSNDRIWVAMHHQLVYYDVKKKTLVFPTSTNIDFFSNKLIRGLKIGPEGNMWGLNRSENSLFKLDKVTGELLETLSIMDLLDTKLPEIKQYGIRNFAFHPDGSIWLISFQDIIKYDRQTKEYEVLPRQNENLPGIQGKGFYNIDFLSDGTAYVSASFNGLQVIRLNEEKTDKRYQLKTMADGLPVDKVIRVKCENNTVWITTRKGLVSYRPDTDDWRTFDRTDGIPNIDLLNYWQPSLDISSDGHIYFGNPDKLIWFHKDSLYHNLRSPTILMSQLITYGDHPQTIKNLYAEKSIHLSADQNFFSVQFGMDDFTQPNRQQFRYRLLGYDDNWTMANQSRVANYTRVPGGDYVLEIEGANSSGIWSENPARLSISVATPFFQSSLFYSLVIALAALLMQQLYRYRVKQIREKDQIRSDLNLKIAEAEMQALRAQMNPHFVFNSLNSINNFILSNDVRQASRYLSKFSKLMRLILNNSSKDKISLQDELDSLSIYIEMEEIRSSHGFDFTNEMKLQSQPSQIFIPPLLLQPFVENSIWHGIMPLKTRGHINLKITETMDHLECVIDDNGIGRKRAMEIRESKKIKRNSKGMKITEDRIRLYHSHHNGPSKVEIEDKYDSNGIATGTKVTLIIPIHCEMPIQQKQ